MSHTRCHFFPGCRKKAYRGHDMLRRRNQRQPKASQPQPTATTCGSPAQMTRLHSDRPAIQTRSREGLTKKKKEQEARLLSSICRALAAIDTFPVSKSCPIPPQMLICYYAASVPEETKWCLSQVCCGTPPLPPQTLNKLLPMCHCLLRGADQCDPRRLSRVRIQALAPSNPWPASHASSWLGPCRRW